MEDSLPGRNLRFLEAALTSSTSSTIWTLVCQRSVRACQSQLPYTQAALLASYHRLEAKRLDASDWPRLVICGSRMMSFGASCHWITYNISIMWTTHEMNPMQCNAMPSKLREFAICLVDGAHPGFSISSDIIIAMLAQRSALARSSIFCFNLGILFFALFILYLGRC